MTPIGNGFVAMQPKVVFPCKHTIPVLQIRRGNKDNLGIISHISP